MKGTKNQIIITQDYIELHAPDHDIFIIGTSQFQLIQKAITESNRLKKYKNPVILQLNIMNGEVKQRL